MKMRMRLQGFDELSDRLMAMPKEVSGAHLRDTALEGAEIIREQAAKNAPVRTGNLANEIVTEVVREVEGSSVTVAIGPSKKAWYGKHVEEGHAVVAPGQRKVARAAMKSGQVLERVPPKPFLRPALDEKEQEATQVMAARIKRRLGL